MNALSVSRFDETRQYAQGWAFSLLVHALGISAAIALVADLHLAPQPEPFRWDVSVVETPTPQQPDKPTPSQVKPTSPPPKPERQPVDPQPVRQTVQTVQQVVRQEIVREVRPVVQATSQMLNRTVQTVQTPQQTVPVETQSVVSAEPYPVETEQASPVVKELQVRSAPTTKADYSWLAEALWNRVEQLKRYPHIARMNRWQGKVVLRAVIREDGQLMDLEIAESSGHSVLDRDAMEVMKQASPLKLKHPLGQPQVVVQVPINYKLQ